MNHQRADRGERIVIAGLAGLCLAVPVLRLLTAAAGFPPDFDLSLLVGAVFVLFAVSELSRPRSVAGLPGWLNPILPWSLLLLLAATMLLRSNLPESAAGGVLIGLSGLLLYRLFDRHIATNGNASTLTLFYLAGLTLLAGVRIAADNGTFPGADAAGGGSGAGPPAWPLIALPLGVWGLLRHRRIVPILFHGLAAAIAAAAIALEPPPFGGTIVIVAAVAGFVPALRRRRRSDEEIGANAERRLRKVLLAAVLILMLAAVVILNPAGIETVLSDHLALDPLYQWELTAGIVHGHPAGVGPGNLADTLATHLVPPEPDDRPLAPWPSLLASDLLRLQAEIGWLFLPLLIWGLASIWALGFYRVWSESSRRDRFTAAPLAMALVTGTAAVFLLTPFASPPAIVGLCLVAALTTAAARRLPASAAASQPAGRPRRSDRAARFVTAATVVATILVAAACIRTAMANTLYRRGVEAFHRQDPDAARTAAAAALRLRGGDPRARLLLAESMYAAGDWAGAARQYNTLLEGQPNNARLSLRLLDCYGRQGFLREAVRLSEDLATTWPTSKAIQTESARWLARDDRPEEAIERFQAVLDQDSQYWAAKFYLAELLESLGRDEEAVYYYRGAAANRPDDPEAFKRLGNNRYRAGHYMQAARYYTEAMRHADDDPDLLVRAGAAYYMVRRYCDALALMEKALESGLDPARRGPVEVSIAEIRPRCNRDGGESAAPEPDPPQPPSR